MSNAPKSTSRAQNATKAPSKSASVKTILDKAVPSAPASAGLQPGMGALPHAAGTTFRVWAPSATAVSVMGTFNDWHKDANLLQAEGDGIWAADLPHAKAGDGYKFVLQTSSGELTRNDPYARAMNNSAGHSLVFDPNDFDWEGDNFQMPSWNDLVIYKLHVSTFNVEELGKPGTFLNVIERLDYLQSLGINCIEIMLGTEFPWAPSGGYNPSSPFALESDYGGGESFRKLVKAAHQHGIAVVLDVAYSHFGPGDLDLWQFDGWSENAGGGIYFYNDWRAETPWGYNRPDYGRLEVRRYILDNALMWLEDYHCDGLCMNDIAFIRNVHGGDDPGADLPDGLSLMRWINEEIRKRQPWKFTIAEDLRSNPAITSAMEHGGEGFSTQWSASFVYSVHDVLTTIEDVSRDMYAISRAICTSYNDDVFQRVIYTESHVEVANGKSRIPEEIAPGNIDNYSAKKRMLLGAALMLTSPGIPMLFQGQEFLAPDSFNDTEPLNWNGAEAHADLTQFYRDLIALRRDLRGVTPGLRGQGCQVLYVNNDAKVIAFARWDDRPENATVVVINFANQTRTIGMPAGSNWRVRLDSGWYGYDRNFRDSARYEHDSNDGENDSFDLSPYATLILSQEGRALAGDYENVIEYEFLSNNGDKVGNVNIKCVKSIDSAAVMPSDQPDKQPEKLMSQERYLLANTQREVQSGEEFLLLVQVSAKNVADSLGTAGVSVGDFAGELEINVITNGFQLVGGSTRTLDVPATGDSKPICFRLRAIAVGIQIIEVSAWNNSAHIAGLTVTVLVNNSGPQAAMLPLPEVTHPVSPLDTDAPQVMNLPTPKVPPLGPMGSAATILNMRLPEPGEYTLEISFEKSSNRYRFQLRCETMVFSPIYSEDFLAISSRTNGSITSLFNIQARNLRNYSDNTMRNYLIGLGKILFEQIVPIGLRHSLWDLRGKMKWLTIISLPDQIPWEAMYLVNPNPNEEEEGYFLADDTTVVRWLYGPTSPMALQRAPVYVVVPPGSPPHAVEEKQWIDEACGLSIEINYLDDLVDVLNKGEFHWIHFASHNIATVGGIAGPAIPFGSSGSFELPLLNAVKKNKYANYRPLVFMNACTTADAQPFLTEAVGWASSFLACGAGAFIGSLWEVRDESAASFAKAFYGALKTNTTLGEAMLVARKALRKEDPTYLAYALYGNPRAYI